MNEINKLPIEKYVEMLNQNEAGEPEKEEEKEREEEKATEATPAPLEPTPIKLVPPSEGETLAVRNHRFLNKLDLLFCSVRQIFIHGYIEDDFFLECKRNFLSIHETLYWYFTEFNQHELQIIFFYGGNDRNRQLTELRPCFADEMLGEKPKSWQLEMKRIAEGIGGGIPKMEGEERISWLDYFYELFSQNKVRIIGVFEHVEAYWTREASEVDRYFTLYRDLLNRKNSPHRIIFTSSLNDLSKYKLRCELVGEIKTPLPTDLEINALFGLIKTANYDVRMASELKRMLCTMPLKSARNILRKIEKEGKVTLPNLKKYMIGVESELVWADCLKKEIETKSILGQSRALEELRDLWEEIREEITYRRETGKIRRKILGYRLLAGPTGTGKTEYYRMLADKFAARGVACRIFNGTEYTQEHTIHRLTGAPPSYIGSPRGELGSHLLEHPNSLILFDEWEKSHIDILKLFIKIFEGDLTLGSGERIDFSNTVILLTSNAGAALLKPLPPNATESEISENNKTNREIVLTALRNKAMPPELEGRIQNAVTVFDHLMDETAETIITDKLKELSETFRKIQKRSIRFDPSVNDFLINQFQLHRRSGARGVVNRVETLRGGIQCEIANREDDPIPVWFDKINSKPIFTSPEVKGAIKYKRRNLANLWHYALDEILRTDKGEAKLVTAFKNLVGQDHVKQEVLAKLEGLRAKLPETFMDPGRTSMGAFVFGGATGVGKTEMFMIIARLLEAHHIKCKLFSMTEFQQESDINALIGSPPGFAGTATGQLGEFLLNNTHAVICFDEFEKCHIKVKLLFLKLLEGTLRLRSGDMVDLSNIMFFFTSNAGNRDVQRCEVGKPQRLEQNRNMISQALQNDFAVPDELIGRLNENILPFNPINTSDAEKVIEFTQKKYAKNFRFHNTVTTFLLDQFIYQPNFGARNLINTIENRLSHFHTSIKQGQQIPLYINRNEILVEGEGDESQDQYERKQQYSQEEKKRIACHEAGHAICAAELISEDLVNEISLTHTLSLSTKMTKKESITSRVQTKKELFHLMCFFLAGRTAEQIIYGDDLTAGGANDIAVATELAKKMIFQYGMGKGLIPVNLEQFPAASEENWQEVIQLITAAGNKANEIISSRKSVLEKLINALVQSPSLSLSQEEFFEIWSKNKNETGRKGWEKAVENNGDKGWRFGWGIGSKK